MRRTLSTAMATVLVALLASAAADAGGRARKGRIVALDRTTLETLRTFRGTARGDAFGTALGYDIVPIRGRAALLIGAPGAADGAGQLRAVAEDTGRTVFTVEAAELGDDVARLGQSLANLGHVDGARYVHWIVGAPGPVPDESGASAGGRRGPSPGRRPSGRVAGTPAAFVLHAVGTRLVSRVRLEGEPASLFGWRVATLDETDVDDSQLSFFAVAAPLADRSARKIDAGAVRAYDTRSGERLWTTRGRRRGEYLGYSLAAAADVDGDGVTDLWVGAPGGAGGRPAGRVYLLSGASGRVLRKVDAPPQARLFGFALLAGDLDRDGELDLFVGAPASSPDGLAAAGSVYRLDGSGAVVGRIDGASEDQWFGVSMGRLLDRDGDGIADLVVSSLDRMPGKRLDGRGRATLLSLATGTPLLELVGRHGGDYFATAAFGPFLDFDGDGTFDYIASVTRAPIAFIPQ